MGLIVYLVDFILGWGVLGSMEKFGFLGVGLMFVILEIRGLGFLLFILLK